MDQATVVPLQCCAGFIQTLCTLTLAVATPFLAVYTYKLWRSTAADAQTGRRLALFQMRPSLVVEPIQDREGQPFLQVTNLGPGPADMEVLRCEGLSEEVGLGQHLPPMVAITYSCKGDSETGKPSLWDFIGEKNEVSCNVEYVDVGVPPTRYKYHFILRHAPHKPAQTALIPGRLECIGRKP